MARFYVVESVSRGGAVGAHVLPCGEDLLPKAVLGTSFGDERRAINLVVHAAQG